MAIKRIVKRRKTQRLDLTGLRGKPIKFVTPELALTVEAAGTFSNS